MITKEWIRANLIHASGFLRRTNLTKYSELISSNLSPLYPGVQSDKELIYLYLNDMKERPKCICGQPVKFEGFSKGGFYKHCSQRCPEKNKWDLGPASPHITRREKNMAEYGTPYYSHRNLSKETLEILNDREKLIQFLMDCSSRIDASRKLSIENKNIIPRYIKKYGIELPHLQPSTKKISQKNLQILESKERLGDLIERYDGYAAVADIIGVREEIVYSCARKLGIHTSSLPSHILEILNDPIKLQEYFDIYGSMKEVARHLGVSLDTMTVRRKKFNLIIGHANSYEIEISELLKEFGVKYKYKDRTTLSRKVLKDGSRGMELDFMLPDYNLAIEFNGDYWHMNPLRFGPNDIHKTHKKMAKDVWKRDQQKIDACKSRGIELIVIWESDWKKSKDEIVQKLFKALKMKNS